MTQKKGKMMGSQHIEESQESREKRIMHWDARWLDKESGVRREGNKNELVSKSLGG